MFSHSDIKSALNCEAAISEKMSAAIDDWCGMYAGNAYWMDPRKGVRSLRLEQAIVRELANVTINEMTVKAKNKRLDELLKPALDRLNINLQKALASGAMVIKPLGGNNVQYVPQSAFIPVEYDVNGRLIKVIFPEVKYISDNDYRIRLEYHDLDFQKGLTITNRAFKSSDGVSLGKELSLTEVGEWAQLPPEIMYPQMLRPAFGYYVNPIDNTIDGSHAGVSVFDCAKDLIRLADNQFGRLDWEFESGERALLVDDAALKPAENGRADVPKLKERLFRGLNISGGQSGDFFREFSPALRQADFIAGLEEYKREIEFAVGLSYGDLSDPQTVDKTATEIKASKQRKYNTVTAIQNNLRYCLEDLCYALAFHNAITKQGTELTVNFKDSILTDEETERKQDQQDVSLGAMPLWEYRMKWYGEDEATAKTMVAGSSAEVVE
ncbi:MAG: phage capsid protein [Ruminococcus sp.]|nr:phage capsid protein [Ruminococcus sp.]